MRRRRQKKKKGGENTFHIGFIWTNPIQIALMDISVKKKEEEEEEEGRTFGAFSLSLVRSFAPARSSGHGLPVQRTVIEEILRDWLFTAARKTGRNTATPTRTLIPPERDDLGRPPSQATDTRSGLDLLGSTLRWDSPAARSGGRSKGGVRLSGVSAAGTFEYL